MSIDENINSPEADAYIAKAEGIKKKPYLRVGLAIASAILAGYMLFSKPAYAADEKLPEDNEIRAYAEPEEKISYTGPRPDFTKDLSSYMTHLA